MAAQKIEIMDIRQLLQLKLKSESNRSCEKILGIHRNTVNHYVRQFKASSMSYGDLLELSDADLLDLFPVTST